MAPLARKAGEMTTLTIHIPIAPGAKTCEGCPHVGFAFGICGVFDKTLSNELDRLPECLAAERVKMGEWWLVQREYEDGWQVHSKHWLKASAVVACASVRSSYTLAKRARIVHVTRYRRTKG